MQDRLYSVLGQTSVCPVVLEIMRRINGEVKMVEMEEGICEDSMDL